MDMKELLRFIDLEDERLKKYYGGCTDKEKRILARTVKLSEELGELCNEVLANAALQRKEKLQDKKDDCLSEEFADVILTTMLLAKSMDVNIEKAIEKKIEKIRGRSY